SSGELAPHQPLTPALSPRRGEGEEAAPSCISSDSFSLAAFRWTHAYAGKIDWLESHPGGRRVALQTEVALGGIDEKWVGEDGVRVVAARFPLIECGVAEFRRGRIAGPAR